MRFLHVSLLALATGFLLSGCGRQAERSEPASSSDQTAEAEYFAEKVTETSTGESAAPPRHGSHESGETSAEMRFADEGPADEPPAEVASIPARDPSKAKPEAPRGPEPDDALRALDAEPEPAAPKRAKRQRPQIEAGTLTAGSLNDHKNLDDYRNYLSEVQQSVQGRSLPPFRLGERVMIEVKDSQGNGVSDVQVTVTQIGQTTGEIEGVLLDTWTRADGR